MENKITGIYNNGTVRVEKYPEPITYDYFHWEDYDEAQQEYQSILSANIAEADKPYWEIEVDVCPYCDGTECEEVHENGTEVTIDRIENNKAVIV